MISTVNKSGTPTRPIETTIRTMARERSVGMVLAKGRRIVSGRLTGCSKCPGGRVRIIGTSRIVRATRPPIFTVHGGGSSSVMMNLGVIGGRRTSTFISSKDAKTILINKRMLMNEDGNIREPPLTPLVPAAGNISLLVSYNTGISTHPSRLIRFTGVNSVCVRGMINVGGPGITVMGGKTRRRGKGTLMGRAFPLLGRYGDVGFVKDVRTESVPTKCTSIIMYRTFIKGIVLGLCRKINSTLIRGVGRKVVADAEDGVNTLLMGPTLGRALGSFSTARCNKTPLLKLGKLIMGARKDTGTVRVGRNVFRYMRFGRRGVGRGVTRHVLRSRRMLGSKTR